MKHIAIFENSGERLIALNSGELLNPYVATVSGSVDINSTEPTVVPYIIDSDGNTYYGVLTSTAHTYDFHFQKPSGATWTLYYVGHVVTASTFYLEEHIDCNGEWETVDIIEYTDYPVENIGIGTGEDSDESYVGVGFTFDTSDMRVGQEGEAITVYYCEPDPCEDLGGESTQEGCECQGRYWYNDTCNDEPAPEPSCEDQGLCDDGEGNCVECEPDPEEEGEPEEE